MWAFLHPAQLKSNTNGLVVIHFDRFHNGSPQKAPITYLLNKYILIIGRGSETGQLTFHVTSVIQYCVMGRISMWKFTVNSNLSVILNTISSEWILTMPGLEWLCSKNPFAFSLKVQEDFCLIVLSFKYKKQEFLSKC